MLRFQCHLMCNPIVHTTRNYVLWQFRHTRPQTLYNAFLKLTKLWVYITFILFFDTHWIHIRYTTGTHKNMSTHLGTQLVHTGTQSVHVHYIPVHNDICRYTVGTLWVYIGTQSVHIYFVDTQLGTQMGTRR